MSAIPTVEVRRAGAQAFYDRLAPGHMDEFFQLFAENSAFEMPFPAPGLVERYSGITGVRKFFTTFRGALAKASWRVERMIIPEQVPLLVAEGRGDCVTVGGARYDNRYLWVFEFDATGRITLVREHSNPLIITASFGGADVLGPAFA